MFAYGSVVELGEFACADDPLAVCVVVELVAHGRINVECRMQNVE